MIKVSIKTVEHFLRSERFVNLPKARKCRVFPIQVEHSRLIIIPKLSSLTWSTLYTKQLNHLQTPTHPTPKKNQTPNPSSPAELAAAAPTPALSRNPRRRRSHFGFVT
ncbi:hypothetical protein AKJ16_DCAP11074 [Drosera capensis]